jgi:hypothetical protein
LIAALFSERADFKDVLMRGRARRTSMADGEIGAPAETTAWRPQSISVVHATMAIGILVCLAMCALTLGFVRF